MTTESYLPTEDESANTSSTANQVLQSLRTTREYRNAFVEEKVRTALAIQIKMIREQRGMNQRNLAERLGKKVSWTYRLEDPNANAPTISTLLEVAKVFDVDLDVRFRSFSKLLAEIETLSPESFVVAGFTDELPDLMRRSPAKVSGMRRSGTPTSINSHQDYRSQSSSRERLGGLPEAFPRPFPERSELVRSRNPEGFGYVGAAGGNK